MSATYEPDSDAQPDPLLNVVFLSNRDLSARVPINFVTHPGVSLAEACFGNGTYDNLLAQKCFSNLLASQIRRYVIDVYWDIGSRQLILCPVAIPSDSGNVTSSTSTSSATTVSPAESFTGAQRSVTVRQTTSSIATAHANGTGHTSLSTTSSLTTTPSSLSIPTIVGPSGDTLYEVGPYQCDPGLTLEFLVHLFEDYLQQTSDTLHARLLLLELNLHAASSPEQPTSPASTPGDDQMPTDSELAGFQFSSIMSTSIYTPVDLATERSNLNGSWFTKPTNDYPVTEYFETFELSNGDLATQNGWPDEAFIQNDKGCRLLIGWNDVDPQMQNYNFTGDDGAIFAPGLLSSSLVVDVNGGLITSGCLYNPGSTSLAEVNSSWAVTTQNTFTGTVATNLTNDIVSCGISPVLNSSTVGSAVQDIEPYTQFSRAAIWNWAIGQPRNQSGHEVDTEISQTQFRCAVMDTSAPFPGQWQVQDCRSNYRVACRVHNEPYVWQLSSSSVSFKSAPEECPINSSFAAPGTGLENTYLYNHVLSSLGSQASETMVWVNFNSLDVEDCWVTSGPNGSCPYYEDAAAQLQRTVLIPTIAAIVALIITVLTIFVKCNDNRRSSKARRRGEGGWDYEGVPS